MTVQIRCFWMLLLVVISLSCHGENSRKTLIVAFGDTLAPWAIPHQDQGILPDILRKTLGKDHRLVFKYLPYARRIPAWRSGLLDIVSDISPELIEREKLTGSYSGTVYAYDNVAVSLASKRLSLLHIDDLYNLSVVAWQGAKKTMGPEFALMAKKNPFYSEHPNQELQVKMLFARRIDVIKLDRQIFEYYRTKINQEGRIKAFQPVRIASIFRQTRSGFLFKSKARRDLFRQRFDRLPDGDIAAIYTNYLPATGAGIY